MALELAECLLDGIEIGAVRRQETHAGAAAEDQAFDGWGFVDAQIVEDDDVARTELGTKHLLHIGFEDLDVGWAFDQERCVEAVDSQGRDEGGGLPMPMRDLSQATLAPRTPARESGHFCVQGRLVDEDQSAHIPLGLIATPLRTGLGNIRPVLLGGVRRFF